MSAINALVQLDIFLSTLKLERGEHATIQLHMAKIRQAIDATADAKE